MPNQFIFLNGDIVTNEEALIKVNDRGFLLGEGLFETVRILDGQPLFFDKHWQRFTKSATALHLSLSISKNDLLAAVIDLLTKNELLSGHASIRITLTGGPAPRGLLVKTPIEPTLMITAFPMTLHDSSPLKVCVSQYPKNARSPIVQHKTTNYLENILSRREADVKGFDDALLLNTDGKVTELTIANVFFIKGECVYTPSIEDGVLPGVIRQTVLEICAVKSIPVVVQSLTLDDLRRMDGMFMTNALMHLRQVSEVQGCFTGKSLSGSRPYGQIQDYFEQLQLESIQTSKSTLQK